MWRLTARRYIGWHCRWRFLLLLQNSHSHNSTSIYHSPFVITQIPPGFRDCVRTQIDHDQSTHYRTASVATGCRHSTPALLSLSRNYIGFELNGGIRSLRSRLCTERYSDARYLNAEFSHTLGSGWLSIRN